MTGLALWLLAETIGRVTEFFTVVAPGRLALAYVLVALACGLIVRGFLRLPHRYLPAWLCYLGRISYGLYVFHAIVLVATRSLLATHTMIAGSVMMVALVSTIGIAALSYRFHEKPFLEWKARFELVKTRPA